MCAQWIKMLVCTALFTVGGAMAQNVTTPGGTPGIIPEFNGKQSLANSVISEDNRLIGIGTKNESGFDALLVSSRCSYCPSVRGKSSDGGGIGMMGVVAPDEGDYAWAESDYWISNPVAATPNLNLWGVGAEGYYSDAGQITNQDMYIVNAVSHRYNFAVDASDNVYIGGSGYFSSPSTMAFFAGANGNVGLGTITPAAKLEVNGNILLTKESKSSITFADGTTQTTAFTGVAPGGDYAESVDVTGERANYVPGDVLVIDPGSPGKFLKSAEPYSTSAAGIYSTKPGTVGRRQATPRTADEVPMAMMGIVPTHVTAENGPIRPGDLLVTSSAVGYAMKGTDRNKMLGAVIGKALGSLDSGQGVVEVIVTLQ
jgi:hypothetical protein